MQTMNVQGTFGNRPINLTITTDVDPKLAATFVIDFYEAMVDQVTETRLKRITGKVKKLLARIQTIME